MTVVAASALETDSVKDSVRFYGSLGRAALDERLRALEEEPDLESVTAMALAGAGILGLVLGFLGSRLWRMFAWLSLPLLFAHARDGLKGPGDFLKTLGLRSRREIQEERFALKILRGDFKDVEGKGSEKPSESVHDADMALEAARA